MPIKVKSNLPARDILENENIFVMTENRAMTHSSAKGVGIEFNAYKDSNRNTDFKKIIKYTTPNRSGIFADSNIPFNSY